MAANSHRLEVLKTQWRRLNVIPGIPFREHEGQGNGLTATTLLHMKSTEVPSVTPLGFGASTDGDGKHLMHVETGEPKRESFVRTGLEGAFEPFVLRCLKPLKSSEVPSVLRQ